jgi:hypothetical protein
MNKFIISEEERSRILNMYNLISEGPEDPVQDLKNQAQNLSTLGKKLSSEPNTQTPLSQFTKDMAAIYGIPEEEATSLELFNDNLDEPTRAYYHKFYASQMNNFRDSLLKIKQSGKFDEFLNQLKTYNGQMTENQKKFLTTTISLFESFKKNVLSKPNQQNQAPQQGQSPQQNQDEKINTTNDKSYDYKLSDGKYYYSKKNENNWVEAKGKGLEAIKSKVKF